jgi:hypothetical protein
MLTYFALAQPPATALVFNAAALSTTQGPATKGSGKLFTAFDLSIVSSFTMQEKWYFSLLPHYRVVTP